MSCSVRWRALGLAHCLGWVCAAAAQTPGVELPPLPSAPRATSLPAMHEQHLPNGLRVVVVPRAQVPLVSVTLLVLAGPEADPAGHAGLAATTATLLGKGARRGGRPVGASELARQAEALGSALDVGSSWHASTLGMSVTTPKLEPVLALLSDVARHPLLAAEELQRARTQALDQLRITLTSPGSVAELAARRAFWADSRYAATPTPASLQRLTLSQVQGFYRQWVRPDNAALVLTGDVSAAQAMALAQKHFGGWRAPSMPLPRLPPVAVQDNPAKLVLIDIPDSGQSTVLVMLPFGPLGSAQRPVAQVANAVLGLGYSARLNQEVRIKRGLSYGVSSSLESHPDASLLSAQAQTRNPSAAQVLELLRSEVRQLGERPAAPDELSARQATLVGAFAQRLESVGSLNALIVAQVAQGRPLDALSRYVDDVLAVTPEQVREFAALHWPPARLRAVVAGDIRAAGAARFDADAQALRVPIDALDLERSELSAPAR
jgi:zinc protease